MFEKNFAVYSADDRSLTFYRRKHRPLRGPKFEGRRVTKVIRKFGDFQNVMHDVESIDVADDNIKPTRLSHWFFGFDNLEMADLTKLDTTGVVYADCLFQDCKKLKTVQMPQCGLPSATHTDCMFYGCESLEEVDMSGYDLHSAVDLHFMFAGCKSLKHIGAETWDASRFSDLHGVFQGCENLEENLNFWKPSYWCLNADFNAGAPGVVAPDWSRKPAIGFQF